MKHEDTAIVYTNWRRIEECATCGQDFPSSGGMVAGPEMARIVLDTADQFGALCQACSEKSDPVLASAMRLLNAALLDFDDVEDDMRRLLRAARDYHNRLLSRGAGE